MIDADPAARPWAGPPCVVARGLADIRAAGATGRAFTALSARGAACFAGPLAWIALARAAREMFPALLAGDILDCADAPGRALEALRLGQHAIVLDASAPGFADVAGRAASLGAVVLAARPPCFDGGLAAGRGRGRDGLAGFLGHDTGGLSQ